MADIRAGDEIGIGYWPEAVQARDDTSLSNQTSTTFIPGSPENGTTFVAPTTGRVGVIVSGELRQEDAANRIFLGFELYLGTSAAGTLILAGDVERGISTTGTAGEATIHGNMSMVSNLTAGSTHYVRSVFSVEGGTTNDVFSRTVAVIPLP